MKVDFTNFTTLRPSEDDSSPDDEKALLDTTIAALQEFKNGPPRTAIVR
jgi:hypothetical protein